MAKQSGTKLIANNKKAYHDYFMKINTRQGLHFMELSKISAYGKMQYQGSICTYRAWRSICVWYAYQPL